MTTNFSFPVNPLHAHCGRVYSFVAGVALFSAVPLYPQAVSLEPGNLTRLIAEGDDLAQRLFQNQKALEKFQEALALAPNDDEVLWRISRCYVDLGEHLPSTTEAEKEKQLATYERSLEYAERAVSINPKSSMAYTRRAIADGRIALFKGVWSALDYVKRARADCEKAIELDSINNAAYYVLGRTHAKVSEKPRIVRWPLGLGWASLEDATTNYEKAISLRPDFIMYRLDAARAYIELDEYEKAKEHLSVISLLPTQDEDDDQFRRETKELLESLKQK
ncbi:MAG: hypothetical protein HY562_02200 [Ignavibacteriales bacterium]|nr:hypothetical protein [Ignavibacteriales bacterium]